MRIKLKKKSIIEQIKDAIAENKGNIECIYLNRSEMLNFYSDFKDKVSFNAPTFDIFLATASDVGIPCNGTVIFYRENYYA